MMRSGGEHRAGRVIEYDALQHRLWVLGQRCHHGATGAVVAAAAFLALIAEPPRSSLTVAGLALGGALMAHDWDDRVFWFERGIGSQPQA